MLAWLTGKWRLRAGTILCALYAFCVLAPAAALALSGGSLPAHCLSESDLHIASSHAQHDPADQHTSDRGENEHDHAGKCCGLFGVTAIAPDLNFTIMRTQPVSHLASLASASLSGRGADRIDRPPRSLLSL